MNDLISNHTHCKACGRQFKRSPSDPLKQCKRGSKYGSYCNDKKCHAIRRLSKSKYDSGYYRVSSHCTENIIKMNETS